VLPSISLDHFSFLAHNNKGEEEKNGAVGVWETLETWTQMVTHSWVKEQQEREKVKGTFTLNCSC